MTTKTFDDARKGWAKREDKQSLAWGDKQAASLWNDLYARYSPLVQRQTVLDFGCSWGYFCRHLLMHHKPRKIIGADIAPHWDRVNHGWDWRKAGERLEFHAGDITQNTAIPDASVDVIFCTSVLQYLRPEQLEATLDKLYSLLRPGGEMILRTRTFTSYIGADMHNDFTVPYVHLLYPKRDLDAYLRAKTGEPPRYLNPLTATTYLFMFQRAGFEIADARRRMSTNSPDVLAKVRALYPFISENELLCAELEARLLRPYEPEELDAIAPMTRTKGADRTTASGKKQEPELDHESDVTP